MIPDFVVFFIGLVLGWAFKDFMRGFTNSEIERFGRTIRSFFISKDTHQHEEYFKIGNHKTSMYVLDGNGVISYGSNTIEASFRDGTPDSPDDIAHRILKREQNLEIARKEGNPRVWDGVGVGIDQYRILRDNNESVLSMSIEFYKSRYAAFQATVIEIGTENRSDPESIYQKYLHNANPRELIPFLARHVGVTSLVVTKDNIIIMTIRNKPTAVRQNEYDVSVVEGIEPTKDADSSTGRTKIDVFKTIIRGCDEELGFEPSRSEILVLGFGVDMRFYQYNFVSIVNTKLTYKNIAENRNGRAKDSWESSIHKIDLNIDEVLEFINKNQMWGFASVSLYWLLINRFSRTVVEARAKQIVTRTDDYDFSQHIQNV